MIIVTNTISAGARVYRYCVAQFLRELLLLRDRPSTDSSSNVLTKTEIDFIVRYLVTN